MKAKYRTDKELQKAIDDYFSKCKDEPLFDKDGKTLTDKNGNPIFFQNPPTVAGLALHLGFEDRRSLYDYKENPKYSHTVKRAITRIEEYAESRLFYGKATGAIFWLKNHGWKDQNETTLSGGIQVIRQMFGGENENDKNS